jgi:hypothetical protein
VNELSQTDAKDEARFEKTLLNKNNIFINFNTSLTPNTKTNTIKSILIPSQKISLIFLNLKTFKIPLPAKTTKSTTKTNSLWNPQTFSNRILRKK